MRAHRAGVDLEEPLRAGAGQRDIAVPDEAAVVRRRHPPETLERRGGIDLGIDREACREAQLIRIAFADGIAAAFDEGGVLVREVARGRDADGRGGIDITGASSPPASTSLAKSCDLAGGRDRPRPAGAVVERDESLHPQPRVGARCRDRMPRPALPPRRRPARTRATRPSRRGTAPQATHRRRRWRTRRARTRPGSRSGTPVPTQLQPSAASGPASSQNAWSAAAGPAAKTDAGSRHRSSGTATSEDDMFPG